MARRLLFWLGSALLVSLPSVLAQSAETTAELASLPSCAQICLVTAIAASPCALTNTTCICSDDALQANVTTCVTANCTVKQGLFTKNVTETICDAPIRDKSHTANAVTITLGVLSVVSVVIRFSFKLWAKLGLASDDWGILVTLLVGIPSTVMLVCGLAANGLGQDVWAVPFDSITNFGFYFYAVELLYFALVSLLKTALLLFFLRIFPTPLVRKLLLATMALNAVYGLTFLIIGIFQCKPISYYWTKWDGEHEGTCLEINTLGWANAAISIALDIWMIAIPLSQLKTLNLHWKKKIGVGIMFMVGTFVTIVSILRLHSLVSFASSTNLTWDQFDVSNWSTIEINVGIICACLPTMRLILVRLFPQILGSSSRSGNQYYGRGYIKSEGGRSRGGLKSVGDETSSFSEPSRAIVCQKSYAVEFRDNDEVSLVHMRDLDSKGNTLEDHSRFP